MKQLILYILAWLALIPAYAVGIYFDNVYLTPIVGIGLIVIIFRLADGWD